jgi:hypothetical protein
MLKLYNIIIYSGALTLFLLIVTFILGLTGYNWGLHKTAGVLTFISACIHGGLVIYKNIKVKFPKK